MADSRGDCGSTAEAATSDGAVANCSIWIGGGGLHRAWFLRWMAGPRWSWVAGGCAGRCEPVVAVNSTPGNADVTAIAATPNAPVYVPVTNEYGQVVAWQSFKNAGEAKDFTEGLHRVRDATASGPQDEKVKLISEEEGKF